MWLIEFLMGEAGRWIAGLIAAAITGGALFFKGRAAGVQKERDRTARDSLKAERNRLEADNEIQDDPDLVARARRNGLVRPDS